MLSTSSFPADFKYRSVYLRGRPVHERTDAFSLRHPKMAVDRRAKLFAPFAALRGFDDAISAKARSLDSPP